MSGRSDNDRSDQFRKTMLYCFLVAAYTLVIFFVGNSCGLKTGFHEGLNRGRREGELIALSKISREAETFVREHPDSHTFKVIAVEK